MKNIISAQVNLANGQISDLLNNDSPETAIKEWLFPESGAPVLSIVINIISDKGEKYNIGITKNSISVEKI